MISRYPDHGYRHRHLPYAQRDLAPAIGSGVGVVLLALVLTLATCARLAWVCLKWALKRVF